MRLSVLHLGLETAEFQLWEPLLDLEQQNKNWAAGVPGDSARWKEQGADIKFYILIRINYILFPEVWPKSIGISCVSYILH